MRKRTEKSGVGSTRRVRAPSSSGPVGQSHALRDSFRLLVLVVLVEHHPGVEELPRVIGRGTEDGAREAHLLGAPGGGLAGFLEPALHDVGAERAMAQGAQSGDPVVEGM